MAQIDKTIENYDFTSSGIYDNEFSCCTFVECNFQGISLADIRFLECKFIECDLSLTNLNNTVISDSVFELCKMLGLQFHNCIQLGFTPTFKNCVMDNCSFFKVKMKRATFSDNRLREVDFSEAELSESTFHNCDLTGATFDGTNLGKADFSTSFGYTIDPESNFIRKAHFSLTGLPGLLKKWDIKID